MEVYVIFIGFFLFFFFLISIHFCKITIVGYYFELLQILFLFQIFLQIIKLNTSCIANFFFGALLLFSCKELDV